LLICVTSANAPIDKPSKPFWEASVNAASKMAARVCRPLSNGRVIAAVGTRAMAEELGEWGTKNPKKERSCYFAENSRAQGDKLRFFLGGAA
jgi:hypothetical protein